MVLGTIFTVRIVQMALFTDLLTTYRLRLGSVIAVVTIVGLLFVIALNIFRSTVPALFF